MIMIYKQYDIVAADIKNELAVNIKKSIKHSASLDDYSSLRNRKYLNINVHSVAKHWNLGMVTILG